MSHASVQTKSTHRILELDGLRGLSVLLVVLFHMCRYSGYFSVPQTTLLLMSDWAGLGVQVFFVISGFIITKLLVMEHQKTGRVSLRGFYTRRFFRIIPAYWFYSFSVVILSSVGFLDLKQTGIPQVTGFLVSNLFLSDIFYPSWFWGHTWSLSVEEQFYIFFPLIFRIIYSSIYRSAFMAVFLILIYASAFYFYEPIIDLVYGVAHKLNSHLDWSRYLRLTFFDYTYITAGVFMAIYWNTVSTALRRLPGIITLSIVLLLATWPLVSGGQLPIWLRPLLIGTLVGWIVVHPEYFGFLRWQIVQLLGACSYSIYMWQQMFTGDPARYGPWYPRSFFVSLFLLFACAGFSYFVVERNFILLGRRLTRDSSRGHPPATVV